MPMTSEPKMNITDGSMKSLKAIFAGRIRNNAWTTPITRLVTPIGMTSNTHQIPASRNRAMAALPSRVSGKRSPAGSTASGNGSRKYTAKKVPSPSRINAMRL